MATWHYIVEIEKKKKLFYNDTDKYKLLLTVLSEITIIRKIMFNYMAKNSTHIVEDDGQSLIKYTSPKLKKLMNILSHLERTDTCLVFVDRRTTAKILYHYIKVSLLLMITILISLEYYNYLFKHFIIGLHWHK